MLVITGVLLILLFSVAAGGTRAGFRLADRALAGSNRAVGTDALRVLLRGVRPPLSNPQDAPFTGGPDELVAQSTPLHATPCTGAGPVLIRLRLVQRGGRTRLFCSGSSDGGMLMDLGPSPAAFSYALVGRPWSDHLVLEPPKSAGARGGGSSPASPPLRLRVRLATSDGMLEVIETAIPPPFRPGDAT